MLNLVLAFYGIRKLGLSKLRVLFKITQPINTHTHPGCSNHEEHKTDLLVTTLGTTGSPVSSSWK